MPIDRGTLEQQFDALGEGTHWWEVRELRDLPAILHADERVLAIARGKLGRVMRGLRRKWLVVVTDRRLLLLRSASQGNWRQLEIGASQITRVTLRIGPFRGTVVVATAGRKYRVRAPRAAAYRLAAALTTLAPAKDALSGVSPTLFARRVIDHVLSLPAAALDPAKPVAPAPPQIDPLAIDDRLHTLEQEVDELRRQIEFLEQLLRQRHEESNAAGWTRSD